MPDVEENSLFRMNPLSRHPGFVSTLPVCVCRGGFAFDSMLADGKEVRRRMVLAQRRKVGEVHL